MSKKRRTPAVDHELDAAVKSVVERRIPISAVCARAGVDQSTLWKWRTGKSSPTMSTRQAVLDAITWLLTEHDE